MARTETRSQQILTAAESQTLGSGRGRGPFSLGRGRTAEGQSGEPRRVPRFSSFWKALVITSFVMNLVLLLVLGLLVGFVINWRDQLIGTTVAGQGFARDNVAQLRSVVEGLENASIKTEIPLDSVTIPIKLNVPVDQDTVVTLVDDVPITLSGARIDLGNGNFLNANSINLSLPRGTPLNIHLRMTIPIEQPLPLKDQGVTVPVVIPLKETELGPQFKGLKEIVYRLTNPVAPLLSLSPSREEPAPAPQATPAPAAP